MVRCLSKTSKVKSVSSAFIYFIYILEGHLTVMVIFIVWLLPQGNDVHEVPVIEIVHGAYGSRAIQSNW